MNLVASSMAFNHSITLLLILISLFSPSLSKPTTPNRICSSTVNPNFCQSTLPQNVSWELYDYSPFCFRRSLSSTKNLSLSISKYLRKQSNLSPYTIRALKDCKELADLNNNFLSRTMAMLRSKNSPLNSFQAEELQALLSATMTNQQTCLDGLQRSSSAEDLHTPLSDGNMQHSLSLALFRSSWGHKIRNWGGSKEDLKPTFPNNDRRKFIHPFLKGVLVNNSVVVNPNGGGSFTTITDVINAAPDNSNISNGYFVIFVVAGVYKEYVNVGTNKMNLMMIGDGINKTVITGNRSAGDGWTTFNSATFIVVGQGFVGVDMTIRNTTRAQKYQAVALQSGADMSTFYRYSFEGYQDTLYPHSLRQFYKDCDIYETVDFIHGNAAVVFQNCNLYPTLPIQGQSNEITAQGRTDPNQNTGISIHNCSIRASANLAASNAGTKTYLGRPWRLYSRTVYMQSFMDSLIASAGWDLCSGDFTLSMLYYAEYNNTGPGADTTNRVEIGLS